MHDLYLVCLEREKKGTLIIEDMTGCMIVEQGEGSANAVPRLTSPLSVGFPLLN